MYAETQCRARVIYATELTSGCCAAYIYIHVCFRVRGALTHIIIFLRPASLLEENFFFTSRVCVYFRPDELMVRNLCVSLSDRSENWSAGLRTDVGRLD